MEVHGVRKGVRTTERLSQTQLMSTSRAEGWYHHFINRIPRGTMASCFPVSLEPATMWSTKTQQREALVGKSRDPYSSEKRSLLPTAT